MLSGLLPRELGMMTSLTELALDYNRCSGPLPSELGRMTAMSFLWLSNNNFTGTIPSELSATNLMLLTLGDNKLSGAIPQDIWQLSHLYSLDLTNLPLLTGPIELSLLSELGYLDLSGSHGLLGTIPDATCSLQNSSCTYVRQHNGAVKNCALRFDCTELLCGCDCPCPNASLGESVELGG
jgi:hypothetical protein